MDPHKHFHLNISFLCLLAAILIVTVIYGMALKKHGSEIEEKNQQLSQLIKEVGGLQQDMDFAYSSIMQASGNVQKIEEKVDTAIVTKHVDLEALKKELASTSKNLTSTLYKQGETINSLRQQNLYLETELMQNAEMSNIKSFLILGHNSGLVDTIILAIASKDTQKITLVSVPRDLSYDGRKLSEIGSVYGIAELQKAVAEVTGIAPQQYVLFDFESFTQVVDFLEGVEIEVPQKIYDNAYPGPNRSYRVVSFAAGKQTMNGEKALQYVRSRKSTSDFDRSKRQQQVISAIKQKTQDIDLLSRVDVALKMYATIQDNIDTNIGFFEALSYLQEYGSMSMTSEVLSTSNLLYSTQNRKGQYILLPNNGNYTQIHQRVAELVLAK